MGEAYFYRLTRDPAERVLGMLVARSLDQGWRVALRVGSPDMLARIDDLLWTTPPESFVPHGTAEGFAPERQPVLLTTGAAVNDPQALIAAGGAQLAPEDVGAHVRASLVFDGDDPAAEEAARAQWRAITAAGFAARYWAQEGGRWVEKAIRPAQRE